MENKLRLWRKRLDLNEKELGFLISYTSEYISKIENEKVVPHDRFKRSCSNVLGVEKDVLFPKQTDQSLDN